MEIVKSIYNFLNNLIYNTTLFKIQDTNITISHLLLAGIQILLCWLLAKWICKILKNSFFPKFKIDSGLEFVLLKIIHYIVLAFGFYIALASINIPLGALLGFFTLLGVGIGFGLQNLAANFISGIILLFERPVKIGDRITVDDLIGDVVQINLRTTVVNTPDNVSIIIPNSKLLENNLTNWSYGDRRIRVHVPVGVAYGSDIDLVTKLLIEASKKEEHVMKDPAPIAAFLEFGDSSLNFELICWIPDSIIKPAVINALNRAIDKAFREADVEIPFPQRDLHIRSSQVKLGNS